MRLLVCIAVLGSLSSFAWAAPKPDPATKLLPADSFAIVRFASLDRFDAFSKLRGIRKLNDGKPWSGDLVREYFGNAKVAVVRDRPVYLSVSENGGVAAFPVPEGTKVAGFQVRHGYVFSHRKGDWTPAEQAVAMPDGDVAAVLNVGLLVDRYRGLLPMIGMDPEDIEAFDVPPVVRRAIRLSMSYHDTAFRGLQSVAYGLTLDGETLTSNGWLGTRPDSDLANGLARIAEQAQPSRGLARHLPADVVYVSESDSGVLAADRAFAGTVDRFLGADAGRCIHALLSPGVLFRAHLTGHQASAIDIRNALAPASMAIWELKKDTPIDEALAKFDVAPLNARLEALDLPARFQYEAAITKQAGVAIHRLELKIDHPRLAAFAGQRKICFAAANGVLLTCGGIDAVGGIRRLLGRTGREGSDRHPHLAAMQRLMPDRHAGFSFNLGAFKPLLGLAAAFAPDEIGSVMRVLPDKLYVSTAFRLERTAIHFRGDWPLKAVLDAVETLNEESEKKDER